jgi:endonuclease YncB( thermonuclease family)
MFGALRSCLRRCCPRCSLPSPPASPVGYGENHPRPRRRSPRLAGFASPAQRRAAIPTPSQAVAPVLSCPSPFALGQSGGESRSERERRTSRHQGGLSAATLEDLQAQSKADPHVRFGLHVVDYPCKVVKVYDGDSLTLAWPRTGPDDPNLCYANTRLYGIDTPELRGTKGKARADAEACRDALRQLVLGQAFLFTTVGPTGLDKYGRPLVVLKPSRGLTADRVIADISPHATLNDWALKVLPGCQPYFGGTKGAPEFVGAPPRSPSAGPGPGMDEEGQEAGP